MNANQVILICVPKGTTKEQLTVIIEKLFEKCSETLNNTNENSVASTIINSNELGILPGVDTATMSQMNILAKNLVRKFGEPDIKCPWEWLSKFMRAYYDPQDMEINHLVVAAIKNLSALDRIVFESHKLGFLYDFINSNDL